MFTICLLNVYNIRKKTIITSVMETVAYEKNGWFLCVRNLTCTFQKN